MVFWSIDLWKQYQNYRLIHIEFSFFFLPWTCWKRNVWEIINVGDIFLWKPFWAVFLRVFPHGRVVVDTINGNCEESVLWEYFAINSHLPLYESLNQRHCGRISQGFLQTHCQVFKVGQILPSKYQKAPPIKKVELVMVRRSKFMTVFYATILKKKQNFSLSFSLSDC